MQALSITNWGQAYDGNVKTGRPPKSERSNFGARLHALREAAGLTQQQVAEKLGIAQPSYALWERNNVALKPDQLSKLATILGVRLDDLLNENNNTNRRGGPIGKARQVFEEVSQLPRSQQLRILGVVEDMLAAQRVNSKAV